MRLRSAAQSGLTLCMSVFLCSVGYSSSDNSPQENEGGGYARSNHGGPQAHVPAAAPAGVQHAHNVSLWNLSIDNDKLNYNPATGRFEGLGHNLAFQLKNFVEPANGEEQFRITIALAGVDYELVLTPKPAEFEKRFTYDPVESGLIVSYCRRLREQSFQEHQRFDAYLDTQGLGGVRFLFARPRTIRYSLSPKETSVVYDHHPDTQQTKYEIYYGFEGSPATRTHVFYTCDHDDQDQPWSKMWCVDASGRLHDVKKIVYTHPKPALQAWFQQNNLSKSALTYSRPAEGNELGLVIDSDIFSSYSLAEAAGKYFRARFSHQSNEDLTGDAADYMYVTNEYTLQRVQQWKYWCIPQQENEVGYSKELQDAEQDGEAKLLLAVLKPAGMTIEMPSENVAQNGAFLPGYFRRMRQEFKENTIIELWEDDSTKNEVTVTFSGVKHLGQWTALNGLPHIRPVVVNGKTVIDLSRDLQNFNEANWTSLKQYLLTLYWVERQHPVLKYHYPDKRFDSSGSVGTKLGELLQQLNCFDLDIDGGWYLVQEPTGKWFLRGTEAFMNRNRHDHSTWWVALYGSDLVNLLKKTMGIHELDISSVQPNGYIWRVLADTDHLAALKMKTIDRKALNLIKVTDSQIMKLISKAHGLESLKIENFPEAAFKPKDLLGALVKGIDTLHTLDVSGVVALGSWGNDFVKIVAMMNKLKVLNVVKTNFPAGQIVALAEVFGEISLTEVGLTMPYHYSNLFENEKRLVSNAAAAIKKSPLNTLAALERNLLPFVLGWPFDLVFDAALLQGKDYESVCTSLARGTSLRKVKLHLRNWVKYEEWTRQEINRIRKAENKTLSDLVVDFEK